MSVLVLGLDPGFSAIGWAAVEVRDPERAGLVVHSAGVFETKADPRKRLVLRSDDNLRRTREIAHWLRDNVVFLRSHARLPLVAICAESFSPPRSASVAAKVAMTWGAVGALSATMNLPIVQCTPQGLKKAIVGKRSASKEEIISALDRRFGGVIAPLLEGRVAQGKWEHPYDAIGAAVACVEADVIQIALRASAQVEDQS